MRTGRTTQTERNRSAKSRADGVAVLRAEATDALVRAFFAEWARVGYAAMSLERVARVARVGKAALYRRWADKAAMASELLPRVGLTITEVDDQGSLHDDVLALLLAIRRVLRHAQARRILVDLHAEIERTPALAAAIRPFQAARRARVDVILDRAVARSEIPGSVDRVLAADLVGAPVYWRLAVLGGRLDRAQVERLSRMVVAGIKAGVC